MLQALTHFRLPRRPTVSRIPSPLPCLKVLEVFDVGSIVCLHGTRAWQKGVLASALSQHSTCSPELVSWLQSEFVQLRPTCKPPRYKAGSPKRAVCELTPAIFDIIKTLSEVTFGRKNRSVANQN